MRFTDKSGAEKIIILEARLATLWLPPLLLARSHHVPPAISPSRAQSWKREKKKKKVKKLDNTD
jgi:hypothetical protein